MTESEWSVPEAEVVERLRGHLDADEPAMLATVVDVEGSAYRRPGAKMVVSPEAGGVGAITAGCLEDEVRELAAEVIEAGDARLETFDLMSDDGVWGMGVGCNGIIDILLEPVGESLRRAVEAYGAGEAATVATVLAADDDRLALGDRAYADGGFEGFPDDLAAALDAELGEGDRSRTVEVATDRGTASVFLDRITPPAELLLIGTGHDVRPVAELARTNDFRVTVVGFRGARATEERFPEADRVVSTSPRSLTDDVAVDGDTFAVVMTHNFVDDRLALDQLLRTDTPYVGLMGPTDRFEEMLEAFESEGRAVDEADLDSVYTPVGLDLGGGAPYQVAHSIVAEMLAVRNGRSGGHLRDRKGPIHARPEPAGD